MALSTKYGKVDIPKIGGDEPVFILRAQDKLADAAIGMYRILAASHGSMLTDSLNREIEAFQRWQGPKKLPD
jgi:flavorubredoxin